MFYHEIFPDPMLNLVQLAEEQSAAMLALQKEPDNALSGRITVDREYRGFGG